MLSKKKKPVFFSSIAPSVLNILFIFNREIYTQKMCKLPKSFLQCPSKEHTDETCQPAQGRVKTQITTSSLQDQVSITANADKETEIYPKARKKIHLLLHLFHYTTA